MKPDRYEASNAGRQRLSGALQKRGSKLGLPTWGGFLFGVPFVAVGAAIILAGTKTLRVDPASVHAPYWVLTVAGASFVLGGLLLWGMTWKQFQASRQRKQAAQQYPNEPALVDYQWHPGGFEVSEGTTATKAVGIALGLTLFLSMFNWWAFGGQGPWMVKGIVGLFDCIVVLTWYQAVRALGRALKFGHSRITFTRFPYALGEPVILRCQPSGGVNQVRKGTFTLRCVQEWTESSGRGDKRSATLIHEEHWSAKWILDQPRRLAPKDDVELRYELPADA
jgi:hypothetical protein